MIWQACQGEKHLRPLGGELYRLVESQQQIATLAYVDTLEEQALLEDMLESSKPASAPGGDYHYLLRTPFRYPPLPWGSRFGRMHEPSLFYGGASVAATLAESAYYRFVFWHAMQAPPPKPRIHTEHTLFCARYKTARGVQLQASPFKRYRAQLIDPADYSATQQLGTQMREAGVQAFEYESARDPERGLCVALYTPQALAQKRPQRATQWLCELSADEVSFRQLDERAITSFTLADFQVQGSLPMPA
jgi:hypothetical protein